MTHALIAAVIFTLWIGSQVAAQEITPQDWPQYNYDNHGTRHNRAETTLTPENVPTLEEKWRYPPEGSDEVIGVVHATPSVVGGFVYFGTAKTEPSFYKLSPSGKLVWRYVIESVMTKENGDPYAVRGLNLPDSVFNAAVVTESAVYFGTFGGQIICLDRFTGDEVWKVNTKLPPFPGAHGANTVMSSPILTDGKLIVAGGGFEHSLAVFPGYPCCSGRGFVAAFDPDDGELLWKYDVGPEPEKYDPPLEYVDGSGRTVKFAYGPSTSSVWSTPSYDASTRTLFFGTDAHNAPRKPTEDDARHYNKYSSAVIAISSVDGTEKWVRQISKNDVWNNGLATWDPRTGDYKDVTIGDTPKVYECDIEGQRRAVVGVGCKNGAFYVLDRATGEILAQTPTYRGAPVHDMIADAATRILALPSAIGGLQTGCAFDGERIYTNGIDWLGMADTGDRQSSQYPPSAGRVVALRPNALAEDWRHERPKSSVPRRWRWQEPMESGDPVASGIAVANGTLFFTTTVSGKLVALRTDTGELLKEMELGPVWCGPSVSRGRVYVGAGNTLFEPWVDLGPLTPDPGFQFPLRGTGAVYSFGLPGEDEVDGLPEADSANAASK